MDKGLSYHKVNNLKGYFVVVMITIFLLYLKFYG